MQTQQGHIWRDVFVRDVQGIRCIGEKPERYGRYEPERRDLFSLMCSWCLGNPSWPALAVSKTCSDETAACTFLPFLERWPDLSEVAASRARAAPIIRSLNINAQWAYLLGLFNREPISVFVATRPELVDQVLDRSSLLKKHEVLEKW
jgi:hypothetical protein